ncbi:hypothetical protein Tco_0210770 [Tanacetum coccineum]
MSHIQLADDNAETEPKYDAKAVSEVNASHIDLISGMISKVEHDSNAHDQFFDIKTLAYNVKREAENQQRLNIELKKQKELLQKELETSGLEYQNPKRLKKSIAAQPKIYDGERLHSMKLIINSPDSEETLEDAKESRLKMKNKMMQLNYEKLNALYETFVPQKEFSIEQTFFSTPSTSNVSFESRQEISELPTLKMPNESKLLKMFDKMDKAILALRTDIDVTLLEDQRRIYIEDGQNTLRQFYKTNVIPMSLSLIKRSKKLKQKITEEVQEMLNIFESMEKKVETQYQNDNMFQNEIDRLLEASFTREIKDCVLISVARIRKMWILMLKKENLK